MFQIKEKLVEVISLFKYLTYIDNFNVYNKILNNYQKVYRGIKNKENSEICKEDFEPVLNVFRMFMEAVPSEKYLTKYILEKMQEVYEFHEKLRE